MLHITGIKLPTQENLVIIKKKSLSIYSHASSCVRLYFESNANAIMLTCWYSAGIIFAILVKHVSTCWDISLKNKNNLIMVLGETSGDHHRQHTSSSGECECMWKISWRSFQWLLRYFSVEVMDQQTNIAINWAMLSACLKMVTIHN